MKKNKHSSCEKGPDITMFSLSITVESNFGLTVCSSETSIPIHIIVHHAFGIKWLYCSTRQQKQCIWNNHLYNFLISLKCEQMDGFDVRSKSKPVITC